MARLWGYVRVSTDDQNNSSQNQQEKIRDFAAKEGKIACICVDEDTTGKTPLRVRPQGKMLWDGLESGDTVVFCKQDRAFRSVRDASDTVHTWLDKGVRAVILDLGIDLATPAGRLFFHQLASFSEFERELISQRTRETFAYLARHQRPYGNRPFGWRRDRPGKGAAFVPLESERELGRRVVQMREGGMSYREICLQLLRERVAKPGKRWTDAKGAQYGLSDIYYLYRAARAGFPIAPRASVPAAD